MSSELKPVQSNQFALAAQETIEYLMLPEDVIYLIFQKIWNMKDVASLNLVSKFIQSINQSESVVGPRLEAFYRSLGKRNPYPFNHTHKYRDYIKEVSLIGNDTSTSNLAMIRSQFPLATGRPPNLSIRTYTRSIRTYVVSVFAQLKPAHQLQALLAITQSYRTSQEITKEFYNALHPAMQTELRWQIWNANGQSSVSSDGVDRGLYFGEHIIDHQINTPLVGMAIQNYLSKFGVDPETKRLKFEAKEALLALN